MNRLKLNSFLVRPLLAQIQLTNHQMLTGSTGVTQKRHFRFGRRVTKAGYYVSPKWFDEAIAKHENDSLKSIVGNEGVVSQANKLFSEEQARQKSLVTRMEKIEIELEKSFPTGEDLYLMMNRDISTPYDCAAHVSQLVCERSALAVVDGEQIWHMHQPLVKPCTLRLLHFKHADPMPVNFAFWRSCSMVLAGVVKKAFKGDYQVEIMSQPLADLGGGSFVCDAIISNLNNWNPTLEEIRFLTAMLWEETTKAHPFERLEVSAELARNIFNDNPLRLKHIESTIKDSAESPLVVYRVGDYLEMCQDPMIANTNQIGSIYLSAVHPLKTASGQQFYRFQGIALPKQLHINAYIFTLLRDRAKQLNQVGLN